VPLAALPCPFAIGCALGECRAGGDALRLKERFASGGLRFEERFALGLRQRIHFNFFFCHVMNLLDHSTFYQYPLPFSTHRVSQE
jgi:hypothetical protein